MNNLSLKAVELPVFSHNLKGYDMHHIIKEVQDRKVDVIGTSKEKLKCNCESAFTQRRR